MSPKYQWIPVPDMGHGTAQQVIFIVIFILNLVHQLYKKREREREEGRKGGREGGRERRYCTIAEFFLN